MEAQLAAIETACSSSGDELVDSVSDGGSSGKTLDRPGIAAAITRIEAGEADALVVAKLDRLSRSLLDFANLMDRARRRRWALIALELGLDTSTPGWRAGRQRDGFGRAVGASSYRSRTAEAMAAKKAAGVHVGGGRSDRTLFRRRDCSDMSVAGLIP
jgi:DNA invertase Pin-like site-specific DNA recombinase